MMYLNVKKRRVKSNKRKLEPKHMMYLNVLSVGRVQTPILA